MIDYMMHYNFDGFEFISDMSYMWVVIMWDGYVIHLGTSDIDIIS